MHRREFLHRCQLAGLGLAVPVGLSAISRIARGAEEPDGYTGPFVVVFNASGGWDTTYLMDPKGTPQTNRLYGHGEIIERGNLRFAPTQAQVQAGMSNEGFLERYGDELLVLNGLDYSVNNHSPCSRYMATGSLDSMSYPTFAALVAACRGAQQPLAFLTFGNYSATGNLVPMSRVPYANSLSLLANADHVSGIIQHPYHDSFALGRIEAALQEQYEAQVTQTRLPRIERSQNMLFAAQGSSKSLQRVTPYLPNEQPDERLSRQADIALAAFKGGVCVSANLSIGQFDSHNNNDTDQMKLIPEFLAGIDYLLRRAEELAIREQLIVVIQSEMARTPTYNQGQGKDHWSVGSVMFLGRGISGNRTIGATDDGQFLTPIHPQTLELGEKQGIRVRPETVHQSLRELAEIDQHPFCQRFSLNVPDSERLTNLWSG